MLTFDYKHPRGTEFALGVLSRCPDARCLGDRRIESWVKLGLIGPPEVNWDVQRVDYNRTEQLRWVCLSVGAEHHRLIVGV